MRQAAGENTSFHTLAMREIAQTLQGIGLGFAFSSKTAQARYEGRSPSEPIHVAIFAEDGNKTLDQRTAIRRIAEATRDRQTIVDADSQLWYTADVDCNHPSESDTAKQYIISITQCQPQACDLRYIDHLPYISPLFLLMSRLEASNSITKSTRDKISKLLKFVHTWHTAAGETVFLSAFSRFPRALGNAKDLCKQYPSFGNSFLRIGIDIMTSPSSSAEIQDPKVDASQLEVARQAAVSVTTVLQNLGIHCALIGGMACSLYGNNRVPKDVDILALPQRSASKTLHNITAEELKRLLVHRDPVRFFLRDAQDPSYKILWYKRPLGIQCSINECKVDIVLPGILHLPNLRLDQLRVDEIHHLPVIPFSLLLLQKLQAWDDRVNAVEPYKRARQVLDASDVQALLSLPQVVSLRFSRPWNDESLFSKEFQAKTKERVKKYSIAFPTQAQPWRLLGFEV
ncbi:hypothetical protein JOM56_004402 [Amanita muscaria]